MTFVFRHPKYYKELKKQQDNGNDEESEYNEDKESESETQEKSE